MRIAVCAVNNTETSPVADRFARSDNFVIYNQETSTYTSVENTAQLERGGAGAVAVKILSDNDIDVVLSPQVGPKALTALNAFEIKAFNFSGANTVTEAISMYTEGKLEQILVPHQGNHKA